MRWDVELAQIISAATYSELMEFAEVVSSWTAIDEEGNGTEPRLSPNTVAALLSDFAIDTQNACTAEAAE